MSSAVKSAPAPGEGAFGLEPGALQALRGFFDATEGLQRTGLQANGALAGRRGRRDRAAHAERSRSVASSASNRRTASWRTNAATCMASASS